MAFQLDDPPASSQLSSVLSDPPLSDNETLGEITVNLTTTSISPSQNSDTHNTNNTNNMPSKITKSGAQPTRQSQRQSKKKPLYRADMSEDELGKELEVSSSISTSSIPAKRNRSDSTTMPARKPAAKRSRPAAVRRVKKWEPDFVTQSTKSPLVTNSVDLRALLLQPAAWDVLSAQDKREILSFFPTGGHILDPSTPDARPNVGSLSSNDTFRHDAEDYVSNISKGMHDPEWLHQAWVAHQRRATGEFDQFYLRKVEVDWNTDIPDEHRPEHLRAVKNGASSSPDNQDNVVRPAEALKLGRSVETPEANGVVENGTPKPDQSAKESVNKSANSTKAHGPARKRPESIPEVADSITARTEEPLESNGGPRFEVITSPDDSEVDKAATHKEPTNGKAKYASHDIKAEPEVDTVADTLEIKAFGGETGAVEEAPQVDGDID